MVGYRVHRDSRELQTVHPDPPYVLQMDASDWTVGAALDQLTEPRDVMPTALEADHDHKADGPCDFLLSDADTGTSKVPVITRNNNVRHRFGSPKMGVLHGPAAGVGSHFYRKALEAWATEHCDTTTGPASRRARLHELF